MNFKHTDLLIPEKDPFANCALGRRKYADVLTELLESSGDGFVMAINNQWGSGKTTFVKMWRQELINRGFKTLYFNAWESDFEIDPLTALLAELKKITPDNSGSYKSLLSKGAIFFKHIMPTVAKGVANKYVDIDYVVDGIENVAKASVELLGDEIKKYAERKKGLTEFKQELENVIKEVTNSRPLVFIIDELDRCRPNYAVEALEKVKHFFSVSGIVFIISIDKVQLGNAIRGFYGSDQIDANEYLRRFIDIEYSIPDPTTAEFCNYLYDYFGFDSFFESPERLRYNVFKNDGYSFTEFAISLFSSQCLTLRQQEKILGHARLAVGSFSSDSWVFPRAFVFLIYLFYHQGNLFQDIKNKRLSIQEFVRRIESLFSKDLPADFLSLLLATEALLLYTYHNSYKELHHKSKLFEKVDNSNNYKLLFESNMAIENLNATFFRHFEFFSHEVDFVKIDFLINKIELLEKINF